MNIKEIPKKNKAGKDYIGYKIINVKTVPSEKVYEISKIIKRDGDEYVEDIIKKIIDTKNQFEEYYN